MVTLKQAVRRALRYIGEDDEQEQSARDIDREVDATLGLEVAELRFQVTDLARRNREYFDVIESIEKQRNEWKTMYFDSTAKNVAAHAMLRRIIEGLSLQNKKAIMVLNGFFEKLGHAPVKTRDDLLALSDSISDEYKEHIDKLTADAPADIDGLSTRSVIAESPPTGEP